MKHLLPLAVLAVALVAAERPDDKKSDKDRLQGTWVVSGVEAKGEALKSGDMFEALKDMKLTFKDDTVLDPFGGVGTVGVAAVQTGRHYVCVDADAEYVEKARARIAEIEAQCST